MHKMLVEAAQHNHGNRNALFSFWLGLQVWLKDYWSNLYGYYFRSSEWWYC
jgi:hypothetical protein